MTDYITNTAELTSVADAIRTKARTTGALEFPADFISAVNGIKFRRIQSIALDGDTYFDTGLKATWDMNFRMDIIVTVKGIVQYFFGVKDATATSDAGANAISQTTSNYLKRDYYASSKTNSSAVADLTNIRCYYVYRHNFRIDYAATSQTVSATAKTAGESTGTMYVGCYNLMGVPTSPTTGSLYRFTIYDDDEVLHDYMPAQDDAGQVCLYDTVTGTALYPKKISDQTA